MGVGDYRDRAVQERIGLCDIDTQAEKTRRLNCSRRFRNRRSPLSYLTMFPFDRIKIDRSFITNLTRRADCAAIVSAVLALARSLDIETVVEGIETEQHFSILRVAGVIFVQGQLFGETRPASELVLDEPLARRWWKARPDHKKIDGHRARSARPPTRTKPCVSTMIVA